jgi:biotin operon repressor
MSTEDYPRKRAETRIECLPPESGQEAGTSEISATAVFAMIKALRRCGMPTLHALAYVVCLWYAGDDLQRPLALSSLADTLAIERTNFRHLVRALRQAGLMEREPDAAQQCASRYSFPPFEVIQESVRKHWRRDSQTEEAKSPGQG